MPITAKQYLWDSLSKGRKTDTLGDMIKDLRTKHKNTKAPHMQTNHHMPVDLKPTSEIKIIHKESYTS